MIQVGSIRKSGAHLVAYTFMKAGYNVYLFKRPPKGYKKDNKVVVINHMEPPLGQYRNVRHPLDIMASWYNLLINIDGEITPVTQEAREKCRKLVTIQERLDFITYESQGSGHWWGIIYDIKLFTLNTSKYKIIRYEDLVGEKGGGTAEKRIEALKLLGLPEDTPDPYGEGPTFITGKIGMWRKFIPEDYASKWMKKHKSYMEALGYEL